MLWKCSYLLRVIASTEILLPREVIETHKGHWLLRFKCQWEILPPSEATPHSLFIFDDVASSKQDVSWDCFSMGRHKFYQCQSYVRTIEILSYFIKTRCILNIFTVIMIFRLIHLKSYARWVGVVHMGFYAIRETIKWIRNTTEMVLIAAHNLTKT